jgi:DNA-binding NarL/FixJ family response regulator
VPRILVGGFGPIARLGLRAILDQPAVGIVAECERHSVMKQLAATSSNVVVLDLDTPGTDGLARLVVARHPAVTVIACSVDRSLMRVYPRFGNGRSCGRELTAAALADAARG